MSTIFPERFQQYFSQKVHNDHNYSLLLLLHQTFKTGSSLSQCLLCAFDYNSAYSFTVIPCHNMSKNFYYVADV